MTQKENPLPYLELGNFLEMLRCGIPVGGKCLTIQDVCHRAFMSVSTYEHVKRAQV